jgi:hypothetical protein
MSNSTIEALRSNEAYQVKLNTFLVFVNKAVGYYLHDSINMINNPQTGFVTSYLTLDSKPKTDTYVYKVAKTNDPNATNWSDIEGTFSQFNRIDEHIGEVIDYSENDGVLLREFRDIEDGRMSDDPFFVEIVKPEDLNNLISQIAHLASVKSSRSN